MKIGALQESPGYEPVDIEPADDGSRNGLRRQPSGWRQCRLDRAKVQMMLFMVAQPLTFVFWSWALHAFGSEGRVINVLLFYLVFSALVVVMFPLGVIDLAAGFLFGVWLGFPVALATKTSGSVLCFLLSRHTCSEYLRRTLVEHYDWLAALSLMMRERQYQTMALLRFSVIPAALKNYGCGSLSVSLRRTVRLKIEGIQREAADRRSREVGGLQGEGMDVFESAHEGHSGGGGGGRGGGAGGGRGNRRVPSLSPGRGLASKSRPASVSSF